MVIVAGIAFIVACRKTIEKAPVSNPSMNYIDLSDTSVAFNRYFSIDLDGNGEKDVAFGTLLVGDPINKQDKMQWLVTTSFNGSLPVDNDEKIPVLNEEDSIPVNNFRGYNWYNASAVLLAQKVIGEQSVFWQGDWKSVSHRFIPVQVKKNNLLYNGWVEVSFSMTDEKLILHEAAICKEAGKKIEAGK